MVRRRISNKKGFTLIELMTTVAIIGTLAAVGVPQYRKFQRKARRAEANMVLGVTASAMSTFNAEYNAITNNLGAIGVDLEAPPAFYTFGFPTSGCGSEANLSICQGACATTTPANFGFAGWAAAQVPAALLGGAAAAVSRIPSSGLNGFAAPSECSAGVLTNQTTWTASANGSIGGARSDQVTINQTRAITITRDGT